MARTRPDILSVVFGPYVQYCPCDSAARRRFFQNGGGVVKIVIGGGGVIGVRSRDFEDSIFLLNNAMWRAIFSVT